MAHIEGGYIERMNKVYREREKKLTEIEGILERDAATRREIRAQLCELERHMRGIQSIPAHIYGEITRIKERAL